MPEVEYFDGEYHLWCRYLQVWPTNFEGPSQIAHYTSKDLWHWTFDKMVKQEDHRKNSMGVYQLLNGKWRMYYTDNKILSMMESDDLYNWKYIGKSVDCLHNSPNVFKLGAWYWLTIDTYNGYAVYRSDDCINWEDQEYTIFSSTGWWEDDGGKAYHSGVIEFLDKVYFFYYIHPERTTVKGKFAPRLKDRTHGEPHLRRAGIQVALLKEKDGKLIGTGNEPFDFYLPNRD